MKNLIIIILVFISSTSVFSASNTLIILQGDTIPSKNTTGEGDDKVSQLIEKVFKYAPLPFAGYSTETNLVLGITKYNAFKIRDGIMPDSLIQPSSILAYAYYTLNDQYKFYTNIDLMHGGNRFNSKLEFLFLDYPSLYFGIGGDSKEEDKLLIDFKNFKLAPSFDYNFYERMYIGGKYIFNNYIDVKVIGDSSGTETAKLIQENEGIQSGAGLTFYREKRNNRLRATKGSYLYISSDFYTEYLGSKFNYTSTIVDLRKYITPISKLTIAGQFYSEIKTGDVPIQSLAVLGGTERMRGIYENRYRDKTVVMSQVELRFPIVWILSGVAFGGMGQVSDKFKNYTMSGFKYGYGAGLRLLIDKSTSSVLRFDISFREDGHSIFIGFNEAF